MPGIPLVVREASYSRSTGEMCRQDSQVHLSAEEELIAEESLSVYCKPVELYNILQRRFIKNPSFLQRCLNYKIQAKHKKRIQMMVTLSGTINHGMQAHSPFPLYVLLARLGSEVTGAEYSAVYRYSRACVLTSFMGSNDDGRAQANFILPEINKLESDAKSGSLAILLLCRGGIEKSVIGIDLSKYQMDLKSFIQNAGGCCVLGKIPFESLCFTWDKSRNLKLGQRAEATLSIEVHPCQIKIGALDEDNYILVEAPTNFETVNLRRYMRVVVSAEEVGAKDRSPYSTSYLSSKITSSSSLSHIIRLRAGNVIFNYRYYNNKLQRTEVTEDFTCPFCLMKCASFKGVKCHLSSSHDLFDFEFWVTEEYQAVNVFVRADVWKSEVIADAGDPKLQTFFMCLKPLRRKRSTNQIIKHVKPQFLELPTGISDLQNRTDDAHSIRGDKARISGVASGTGQSYVDSECVQSVFANNLAPPAMLQFAKTRKLSFERAEPRNRLLLQKRQFFHSHRAQSMAKEQVMSDRDSEDEVDDDVADFEDRRMLDDFVDVTKDEKQIMHLWNSFVRKQRVLADGHIPWACEAFSGLHGPDLVKAPALIWCWRLLMIKLWNHGLLDGRSMNNCNLILERCQQQELVSPPDSDIMKS